MDTADTPDAAAWSLAFHQAVRNRVVADSDDRFERTEADIALADHYLFAEQSAEAERLLEPRLAALPNEDLCYVLPPVGALLTAGEGGQPAHIRAPGALFVPGVPNGAWMPAPWPLWPVTSPS